MLQHLLEQLEAYESDLKSHTDNGATIDYRPVYVWISPSGVRRTVTKAHLEGGTGQGLDGWPLPGEYQVTFVDSNDEAIGDTWIGEHIDRDTLLAAQPDKDAGAQSVMALVRTVNEEARLTISNQRRALDEAIKREERARKAENEAKDALRALQDENARLKLAAERAAADKSYAEAKQIEAETAYTELDKSVRGWQPQIHMAVDHMTAKLFEKFGAQLPWQPDTKDPETEEARQVLNTLLEALIFDIEVVKPLVEAGKISWDHVRFVAINSMNQDPGPMIDWTLWGDEEVEDGGQ